LTATAAFNTSSPKERAALRSAVGTPQEGAATSRAQQNTTTLALLGLLAAGLIIRLLFVGAEGFKNDVSTFEAWALTLSEHPLREFYAKAGFADYPPGYFFVLALIGHAYKTFVHSDPTYAVLKAMVKLPGILMDLVDGALLFAIVRRCAPLSWAFAAAAFFVFNPAGIFISAYWGQVDSVAAGFVLGALLLVLRSSALEGRRSVFVLAAAWMLLACSILIKPPAVVIAPLLIAFALVGPDARTRTTRLAGTALGICGGLVLAYLAACAFHAGWNPLEQFVWLYGRYKYASGVYAYNSVNAFDLYALRQPFWQSDSQVIPNIPIGSFVFGMPQYAWGVGLLAVACLLLLSRYVQRRDNVALLEAAFLSSLAYFILSTRMHERYVYDAFMLVPALMFVGRRYVWAALILTVTLLGNLGYSLHYLAVMDAHTPGVDPTNLMPLLSRSFAFLNVAVFFYLGYVFLGARSDALERLQFANPTAPPRSWFAPLEGVSAMLRVDYLIAGGLTVLSFVIEFVNFWFPKEKIFDEIYYARAAEEYIAHKEIFEYTHPPLTKLLITLSTLIFHDNSFGWRFGNVVVGALTVFVLYVFAKRILGSTPFAAIAAGLLVFDGFHFVQSRIATPEITVAFFSLTTLYAFYRYWLAAQVRVAPTLRPLVQLETALLAGGTVIAGVIAALVGHHHDRAVFVVTFLYVWVVVYVAIRMLAPRLRAVPLLASFADGSTGTAAGITTFDGGSVGTAGVTAGEVTKPNKGGLAYVDDDLRIEYRRDGSEQYATPDGAAAFSTDGTMVAGGARIAARDANLWLWMLALSGGALAASKWNGLFDFMVVFGLIAVVVLQAVWVPVLRAMGAHIVPRPALLGNPRGFSIDVVIGTMLAVAATIYVLAYIPYFRLGHDLSDLLQLQRNMFTYHYDLHATHPYSSKWWQWPLLQIPISYYYKDFRASNQLANGAACCVGEILALPNPLVWWLGLLSVPFVGWLAWRERLKSYILLIVAYFLQWLPWIASPRVAFEYHFYPNLAVICLADAILLQRVWRLASDAPEDRYSWPRVAVVAYLVLVVAAFIFWYPVLAGTQVTYDGWAARMLEWLMGQLWINPHPGQ
jgi:predicted membrane-bound dolichyl-phosphate-mannose-protein mannosyltransferase